MWGISDPWPATKRPERVSETAIWARHANNGVWNDCHALSWDVGVSQTKAWMGDWSCDLLNKELLLGGASA